MKISKYKSSFLLSLALSVAISVSTSAFAGNVISQSDWNLLYVDSEELVGEDGAADNAFDGNNNTFWHSKWAGGSDPIPHEIQIDLGATYELDGFRYLPRQDGYENGRIGRYEFYTSNDGESWGTPASSGSISNDVGEKRYSFSPRTARYIRLVSLAEVNGKPWTTVAELKVTGQIAGGNQAPSGFIDSPSNDVTINAGESVYFAASGSDPENDNISYAWDFASGASNSNREDPGEVVFNSPGTYQVTLTVSDENGLSDSTPDSVNITVVSNEPTSRIPQSSWRLLRVDSQELNGEDGAATNAFDGDLNTIWHSKWWGGSDPIPHEISIDLGDNYQLDTLYYTPRQDGEVNGRIARYEFYTSTDGVTWGSAAASGVFNNNRYEKEVPISVANARYIRLVALSEVNGKPWTSMAEINVKGALLDGEIEPQSEEPGEVNQAPNGSIYTPQYDVTIYAGESLYFLGDASDPDNDELSYEWDFSGGANISTAQDPGDVVFNSVGSYRVTFTVTDEYGLSDATPDSINVTVLSNNQTSTRLSQSEWRLHYVDSQEPGTGSAATNAFDGNINTKWHSKYSNGIDPIPHEIQIDLGADYSLDAFYYTARQGTSENGMIANFAFYVSDTGYNWGSPVATGIFSNSRSEQEVALSVASARYIRLVALSEVNGKDFTSVAEINVRGRMASDSGESNEDSESEPTETNQAPAGYINTPQSDVTITAGESVYFLGDATDPENDDLSFSWSFDGGAASSILEDPADIVFNTPGTYEVTFTVTDEFGLSDPFPDTVNVTVLERETDLPSTRISQAAWQLMYVDSEEPGLGSAATNAFDGDINTKWHTKYSNGIDPIPHEIQIDLGDNYSLDAFYYYPRQGSSENGMIAQYEFYTSLDGYNWVRAARGLFNNSHDEKEVLIAVDNARYVRLVALSEVNGKDFTSMAEFNFKGRLLTDGGSGGGSGPSEGNQAPNGIIDTPTSDLFLTVGQSINFTGTGSDPDGDAISFYWDFDGAANDSTEEDPGTINFDVPGVYQISFSVMDSEGLVDPSPDFITVNVLDGDNRPTDTEAITERISQSSWVLRRTDSQELDGEDGHATNAFDGDPSTYWHTRLDGYSLPMPHEIAIDLGDEFYLDAFYYLPRQNSQNGRIARYELYVSMEYGEWGSPIASGTFLNTASEQEITFSGLTAARYIRLVASSEVNGNPWTAAAELNFSGVAMQLDSGISSSGGSGNSVANNDYYISSQDVAIEVDLAANDVITRDVTMYLNSFTEHGQVTIVRGGRVLYTPNDGYFGPDYFVYQLIDAYGNRTVGNVDIEVRCVRECERSFLVTWDPSVSSDVVRYTVYVGNKPNSYDQTFEVGNTTQFVYSASVKGEYYFTVTAINDQDVESDYSQVIRKEF